MTKYIKKHWKDIVLSLATAFAFAYFLGLSRPYKAFGGEDLLPIMTSGFWLFSYLNEQEDNKNDSTI